MRTASDLRKASAGELRLLRLDLPRRFEQPGSGGEHATLGARRTRELYADRKPSRIEAGADGAAREARKGLWRRVREHELSQGARRPEVVDDLGADRRSGDGRDRGEEKI